MASLPVASAFFTLLMSRCWSARCGLWWPDTTIPLKMYSCFMLANPMLFQLSSTLDCKALQSYLKVSPLSREVSVKVGVKVIPVGHSGLESELLFLEAEELWLCFS